jgi:KipI family sensor histidine kinase inhibitor
MCYDGEDLAEVAQRTGRAVDEVLRLHAGAEYTVRMLGFLPGFPYLDGLPEALRLPRLGTPRLAVPAGSVAIAEGQCGIYPVQSPGGWRILGRTDLVLFDPRRDPPALLAPGDRVRFLPR